MKRTVALIVVVGFFAGTAQGADRGISQRSLSAMGLPGLRVMSDVEGMKVRGTRAVALGASVAASQSSAPGTASSASTLNLYAAGGHKLAAGINGSGALSFAVPGISAAAAGGFSAGVSK